MSTRTRRRPGFTPETDHPEWAAWYAATRLTKAEYMASMRAIVFQFGDGRIFGVPLDGFGELDDTPITRISLVYDGDAASIEQASGNQAEVPWDFVLHAADPTYAYCRHLPDPKTEQHEHARDVGIGELIRAERLARGWTLAELGGRTGIKAPNLSRLEKGKHSPSLDTLMRVADSLGIALVALLPKAPAT